MSVFTEHSTITCPACSHQSTDRMPTDSCQWYYDCKDCGVVLKPKTGNCSVYCSDDDVECPSVQAGDDCCG